MAHCFARQMTTEHRVNTELYYEAKKAFEQEGLVNLTFLIGIYLSLHLRDPECL